MLAREIVNAIGKEEKRVFWLAAKGGNTKKLYAKILRSGIKAKVQCEVGRKGSIRFFGY